MEENKEKNFWEGVYDWWQDNQQEIVAVGTSILLTAVVFGVISTVSYNKGMSAGMQKGLDSIGKMFEAIPVK